jgi:glycerol-3-phosphate dehydrogenase
MWRNGWRNEIWSQLDDPWDLIVIGGGITGAGILLEAAHAGLRALLVEAHDFASGTSSRSSKLVHGGFRYLKNFQLKLVRESVGERERLLKEGRGLVTSLGVLLVNYAGDAIPDWVFGAGLVFYDLLALKWGHRHYDVYDMRQFYPALAEEGLRGGYRYFDAQTDDARLVVRIIQEAVRAGGAALNYAGVTGLLRSKEGQVCGVVLQDNAPESQFRSAEAYARVVVNATGAWADELRAQLGQRRRLRRLRGSHLIFPAHRFPLSRSISFLHPQDGRPVFVVPWEGVTLLGTTDKDHEQPLTGTPTITPDEAEYLLEGVQRTFPGLGLSFDDIQATFAGIRPVVDTGKADPCKESREHILWSESGLLTITGGKLTTFRSMAHAALMKVRRRLPGRPNFESHKRLLPEQSQEISPLPGLSPSARLRLLGRHGGNALPLVAAAQEGEMSAVESTPTLWAELRWAARAEGVVHLDDLLLRRTRLGLLLPEGGASLMEHIRCTVQDELGWDNRRWQSEVAHYTKLWKSCYHLGA